MKSNKQTELISKREIDSKIESRLTGVSGLVGGVIEQKIKNSWTWTTEWGRRWWKVEEGTGVINGNGQRLGIANT